MDVGDAKWVDRDAGPVVRPYALTGGRTEPATGAAGDRAGCPYPGTSQRPRGLGTERVAAQP